MPQSVWKQFKGFFTERGDRLASAIVLLAALVVSIWVIHEWSNLYGVGVVGLITFFLVAIAGMFGSREGQHLDQGQIRRAVVAAWVTTFFALLAVGNGIQTTGSVIANTLSQYWWAFTIVFSTYIAGRSAESIATTLKPKSSS